MKMSKFEKRLVNNAAHTQNVVHQVEELLRFVRLQSQQHCLEVDCGNGAVAKHLANKFQLKVNGYFIYVDLSFPEWLAALGKHLVKVMGFPTVRALEAFMEKYQLSKIHTAKSFMNYEVVCRK